MKELILPGGPEDKFTTDAVCAREVIRDLAETKLFFFRGGVTMELGEVTGKLKIVEPAYFKSRLCDFFYIKRYHFREGGGVSWLKSAQCPENTAKMILASKYPEIILPNVDIIVNCPVLTERKIGGMRELECLTGGFYELDDDRRTGIYVRSEIEIDDSIDLEEAKHKLLELLVDFKAATPGDKSRMLASFLSPAFRMGQLFGENADFPMEIAEADESQSGKTYRQKVVAAIYNETPFPITANDIERKTIGEMIGEALISGKSFMHFENWRGKLNSPLLESILRGIGEVTVRVPYHRPMCLSTRYIIVLLSSNSASMTVDLRNRCVINRIRKQKPGYKFKRYPEGHLLEHVQANRALYLSYIFKVVEYWYNARKPRTNESRHDFQEWVQPMDWIVQRVFGLASIMDSHQAEQIRLSNPALSWFREVVIAIKEEKLFGEWLRIGRIAEVCQKHNVTMGENVLPVSQQYRWLVGAQLKQVFGDRKIVEVEEYICTRKLIEVKRDNRNIIRAPHYRFEINE